MDPANPARQITRNRNWDNDRPQAECKRSVPHYTEMRRKQGTHMTCVHVCPRVSTYVHVCPRWRSTCHVYGMPYKNITHKRSIICGAARQTAVDWSVEKICYQNLLSKSDIKIWFKDSLSKLLTRRVPIGSRGANQEYRNQE